MIVKSANAMDDGELLAHLISEHPAAAGMPLTRGDMLAAHATSHDLTGTGRPAHQHEAGTTIFRWQGTDGDGTVRHGEFTAASAGEFTAAKYCAGWQALAVAKDGGDLAAEITSADGERTWWAETDQRRGPETNGAR